VEAAEEGTTARRKEGMGSTRRTLGRRRRRLWMMRATWLSAWQVLESARVIYERMPARSLDEA